MGIDIKKNTWWSGGGGFSAQAEYDAIIARAGVRSFDTPSAAQQIKQTILLSSLKTSGVLAKLDWLYLTLNNIGLNFARLNWVAPSTFEFTGTPTWTSNQGIKSVASSYADTTWAFSDGVNYTQNSGCCFGWVFTDGNDSKAIMGAILSGPDRTMTIISRDGSNRCGQYALNSGTGSGGPVSSMPSDLGLHIVNRVDSANQTHYRNNVQTATAAAASVAPTDVDVSLLARNFNGTRDSHFVRDCSIFGAGAGLTSDERTALYNACNTYVTTPE
jgi:hypothetical protein